MSDKLDGLSEQPAGVTTSSGPSTGNGSTTPADAAPTLLQLAARLHTAHGNPQIWRETLLAFRHATQCQVVHGLVNDSTPLNPDSLAALAGRLTHCATFGDECGNDSKHLRPSCAEFAIHMHTASLTAHKSLKAAMFDLFPATWIVNRCGQVLESNTAAQSLILIGEHFTISDGLLKPLASSGAFLLRRRLEDAKADTRVFWHENDGSETTVLLRMLPDPGIVAVTLKPSRCSDKEMAALLAQQLGLTPRRSELGAHLLEGHTLTEAARIMGISRDTANEHLSALLRQVGVTTRKALLQVLRNAAQQ